VAAAYWIRAKRALARADPVLAGIIRDRPRIALPFRLVTRQSALAPEP